MEFLFTTEASVTRTDEIIHFLRGPRLWIPSGGYPDFDEWTDKVHRQLRAEEKRAIVAISRGDVVGAIVYQRDRSDPAILEVKNLTVRPDARGRYLASFLARNAEIEGAADFPGVTSAHCDAKAGNAGIRLFLLRSGYRIAGRADLYGKGGGEDLLFRKPLANRVIRP